MSTKKKIEIYNSGKLIIKLSLGPIAIFGMVGIIQAITSLPNDVASLLMFIMIALYCVCVIFNKNNKMQISIEEYLQRNSNVEQTRLKEKLYKHGLTENEIKEIMKNRPLGSVNTNEWETKSNESYSSTLDDLKEGFVISKKILTKEGLGIVIDSKLEEFAIMQPNKDIQYIKFNQIHSYNVNLSEVGAGNGAMAFASITGNDSLYKLGMANTIVGNKNICAYIIQLVLNDVDSSNVDIHILHKKMLNNSASFAEIDKVGKEIISFLDKIISKKDTPSKKSNLSEIKELKELLDLGAINQEEFDEKKKELLKTID